MTIVTNDREKRNKKNKKNTEQGWKMTSVYTVGEIRNITSKYTQNKVGRWQLYILLER
jgi:hypothetical protein